jgi:hypothetical protein
MGFKKASKERKIQESANENQKGSSPVTVIKLRSQQGWW